MAEYNFAHKKFLTTHPHQNGSVGWYVDVGEGESSVDCDIRLTDCYKAINLEMYWDNAGTFGRRINKLDELIVSLNMLKQEMYAAEAVRSLNQIIQEVKNEQQDSKVSPQNSED